MKKIFLFVFCVTFSFLFGVYNIALPINYALAEDETDQICEDAQIEGAANSTIITGNQLSQSFTPATTTLTDISLAIAMQADNTKNVTIELRKITGGDELVATKTVTGTSALIAWLEFSFDNITLDTTKQYGINVTTVSTTAVWYYSTASCYAGGMAYIGGAADAGKDFGFLTLGHGVPEAIPAQPDVPDENTISNIAEPTDALAEYSTATNKVKVTWTKSETEDIDGYNIYRSETKTKGFTKTGKVDKKIYEYSDTDIAANKIYYYYIKAYKGSTVGMSSNIAEVKVPVAAIKKMMPAATAETDNNLFFYILFGSVVLMLIIFLVVYEIKLKKLWQKHKPLW